MNSPPGEALPGGHRGSAGEKPNQRTANHSVSLWTGQGRKPVPSDTAFVGYMLDVEHIQLAGLLIRETKNPDAVALLARWRREQERFPFIVVAGRMERSSPGVVGGLSSDWTSAKLLFAYACDRLDSLVAARGSFSSAWFSMLTDERQTEIRTLLALRQQVGGHA